ncbi:MAG: hypothetical protein J5911_06065 [Clostridia bacterium]|nr:hypothetical protein [Clostridia bacterium]
MFGKKILVMKHSAENSPANSKACGICRLEKEDDTLTVCLSLIGFPALTYGEYRLYIVGDDKNVVKKTLGNDPSSSTTVCNSALSVNIGVSAGIWTVKDDIPLLIAYRKSEDAVLSAKEYGAIVVNDIITERKTRERKEFSEPKIAEEPASTEPPDDKYDERDKCDRFPPLKIYEDDAVATENFYDDDIKRKLCEIKEFSDEYIRRETSRGDSIREQKTQESHEDLKTDPNETDAVGIEDAAYYQTVKAEIDEIFAKYPEETEIEKTIADSRFAKVYYAENKYYIVGLIKEKKKEKYICYGVPSKYCETPPKELAGYCSFVPLSVFNIKGDGYFMMFQDAATGMCVRKG